MDNNELEKLLSRSSKNFGDGLNSLVKGIVADAVEDTSKYFATQIGKLNTEIERYKNQNCILKKERDEAIEGQEFYKKKLELEQAIPKLSSIMPAILKIVTLFYKYLPTITSAISDEHAKFIETTIINTLKPYGRLIHACPEAPYDPSRDESITTEPAPNYFAAGKIKEIQCFGFVFDKKFNLEPIKEKVVVYEEMKAQRESRGKDFNTLRLLYSLYCVASNEAGESIDQQMLCVKNNKLTAPLLINTDNLKCGDVIRIITVENGKERGELIRCKVPDEFLYSQHLMLFWFEQSDQYLKPKIIVQDKYDEQKLGEVFGREFPFIEIFHTDIY